MRKNILRMTLAAVSYAPQDSPPTVRRPVRRNCPDWLWRMWRRWRTMRVKNGGIIYSLATILHITNVYIRSLTGQPVHLHLIVEYIFHQEYMKKKILVFLLYPSCIGGMRQRRLREPSGKPLRRYSLLFLQSCGHAFFHRVAGFEGLSRDILSGDRFDGGDCGI